MAREKKFRKRRGPFLIFLTVVGAAIIASITFVQSARFARIVKSILAKNTPAEWGIKGDFSEFRVNMFPPGISIENPKVVLETDNIVNLPAGSAISAERIDLKFYPLQMLSGNVRVHEAVIENGDVQITIDPEAFESKVGQPTSEWGLRWEELFQIRAEGIVFVNTRVQLTWLKPEIYGEFVSKELRLVQWDGPNGLGYELEVELQDLEGRFPENWTIPDSMDRMRAHVQVNSAGVNVKEISFLSRGVEALISGRINGDIFRPEELMMKSNLSLNGDLAEIVKTLQLTGTVEEVSGRARFEGQVEGDLTQMKTTLKARGRLDGENLAFRKWSAESVLMEGNWNASSLARGGELVVDRAEVRSSEYPRVAPDQGGTGGSIRFGSFKVPFGNNKPIRIPVELSNAHIHWLAAPALKDVFLLDFRMDGRSDFTFIPSDVKDGWQLRADLDLRMPYFQLDNQRLGRVKALKKLLQFPDLSVRGEVLVDSKAVRPLGVQVTRGSTQFSVGGKIDFKTGYALEAKGRAHLEDIGELAEAKILGQGDATVTVKGPVERVLIDFDVDIDEAKYLNLNLGKVKGLIRFDDGDQVVYFKNANLKKGETLFSSSGSIDTTKDTIELSFSFPSGRIQDLDRIFSDFTGDLWWFPNSISGDARGTIQVSGGLDLDLLKVMGKIRGQTWDFYGEKFDNVFVNGGFDRQDYVIKEARANKGKSLVRGSISYTDDKKISWSLRSNGLSLRDLDAIERLDVPIRGDLTLSSDGTTEGGHVVSSTNMALDQFIVRGVRLPRSELSVRSENSIVKVYGRANGGQGIVEAAYDMRKGKRSYLRADFKKLDFSPALLFLNPKLIYDSNIVGTASGKLHLDFEAGAVEYSTGEIAVQEYVLGKTGSRFVLEKPVSTKITKGTFSLPTVVVSGRSGKTLFDLSAKGSELDGSVQGTIDLGIGEFFTPVLASASGLAQLDYEIGGSVKDPEVTGRAKLAGASVRVRGFESALEQIRGVVELEDWIVNVRNVDGELGGGRASTFGTIELFANRFPKIDLRTKLSNNRFKVFPFQYVKVRGTLHTHGETKPYTVDGEVRIDSALSREKVLNRSRGQLRKTARFTPPPTSFRGGDNPTFMLNIHAVADGKIYVVNDLFDAELKGDVYVINTIPAPRLKGQVGLVEGSLSFKGREFKISEARVEFDNPAVINPKFDLTATADVSDKKIRLYADGRMDDWKVEFSSDPPLSESEIVSLLALGFTPEEMSRLSGEDQTAVQSGEAASLLLHATDFNRGVRERTGLEIQVEQSEDTQTGQSIFQPISDEASTGAAPKVVIKRRIGKKLDVSVGSTVGAGNSSQQEFNAELNVAPNFSVIGVWNNFEGTQTQESQTSFGLDLKLQKRFK